MVEEEKICPVMSGRIVSIGDREVTEVPCVKERCQLYIVIEDDGDNGRYFHWQGCGLVKPAGY